MRQLIAGNWKMNGLRAQLAQMERLKAGLHAPACDVLVCPPATLLIPAAEIAGGVFAVGGQDCAAEPPGAHTGDIAAEMLKDAGATAVILGHSERRQDHGERDAAVAAKVQAAWRAGLTAIICVGETEEERDAGKAAEICHAQIRGSVPKGATAANTRLAYEPIWAIGSGKTASSQDILAMHAQLRHALAEHLGEAARALPILYGGSVNPGNARAVLSLDNVNGALVGGASLNAMDFLAIIAASNAS